MVLVVVVALVVGTVLVNRRRELVVGVEQNALLDHDDDAEAQEEKESHFGFLVALVGL
jgi:hypothetical protein